MAAKSSKHEEISRELRERILSGNYGANGRLPSESQLVKSYAASRPTVARALRTLQEEGLVERRAGSGSFVSSRKPGGRTANTRTFALLMPDLRNTEIFQAIAGQLASLARVHEFGMLWGGSGQARLDADPSLPHGEELCDQFIEKRAAGVFFAPYELVEGQREANRRMAQKLHDAGIPVVLIDRDFLPFPQRSGFDLVGVDNIAGGYAIGRHLIRLGCRRVCFVHPPHSAPTIGARIAGVRAALDDGNQPARDQWVFEGNCSDLTFVRKILAVGKADAIVGSNDHTAALLMQSLTKNGVCVPRDVRVIGFDDVVFSTLVSPPLTTVQQPCREIALTAFRAMVERMAEPALPPRHISLTPRLIIRDSCGAYSQAGSGVPAS